MKEEKNENGETLSPEKKKKIKKVEVSVLSVLLALVVAAVGFIAGWFGRWGALGEKKQSLLWAIDKAQENYYQEIDEDALYQNLFAAFNFDRYSTYYSKEDYATIAAEREGQNRDAGFSVYGEESHLEVYDVIGGSSAATAGITNGMHFLKFGKTKEALKTGTAEDYFAFVANLDINEKYFVLCGESENAEKATAYEVVNGEQGAGIALTRKYSPMRVFQVVGNSPADHAGLKRGMYILKYGATANVNEMESGSSSEFFAYVNKLTPDDKGNVTIHMQCSFDKADQAAKVYSVTMQEYQATYCYYRDDSGIYRFRKEGDQMKLKKTEEETLALPEKTAYIALTQFTGNAATEFKACLNKMKENGKENLVLDLRGNGGGYMDVFVEIASCLLKDAEEGAQKVAYAKFRSGAVVSYSVKRSLYGEYFGENSRVSVLADENTASASECLIGALVDYGTVAYSDIYLRENENGEAKTYGKGIMQTHYEDENGNTLKLTSAVIYWPKSNKTIHDVGVTPQDGAVAIPSALLPDANDAFLQDAIERIQTKGNTPSVSV